MDVIRLQVPSEWRAILHKRKNTEYKPRDRILSVQPISIRQTQSRIKAHIPLRTSREFLKKCVCHVRIIKRYFGYKMDKPFARSSSLFVISSLDLVVLRAQRIVDFLILITHKSTKSENPITWVPCLKAFWFLSSNDVIMLMFHCEKIGNELMGIVYKSMKKTKLVVLLDKVNQELDV